LPPDNRIRENEKAEQSFGFFVLSKGNLERVMGIDRFDGIETGRTSVRPQGEAQGRALSTHVRERIGYYLAPKEIWSG